MRLYSIRDLPVRRSVYKPLGFLFLGLALLGVFLPVLPGTPFALLAAWFFARSSERWHQWLLHSDLFGPTLQSWERERCIPCRVKIVAISSMLVAGSASIFLALDAGWMRWMTAGLMLAGAATVLSIRTCGQVPDS